MSTIKVEYVGLKPKITDCAAGTGITWVGRGCVRDVPADAWRIMSKHPDVWALVEEPVAPPAAPTMGLADAKTSDEPRLPTIEDAMEAQAWKNAPVLPDSLEAQAEARGIKVDGRLKGEKRRAALVEALAKD